MTTKYLRPDTAAEYRVDARECFNRAQRALEVAEVNLDATVEATGGRLDAAESLAHADARARVGQGWAALGLALRGYNR